MGIEVLAQTDRDRAVFMAGETFTISIILKNSDDKSSNSLAWGCIQLHCDQVLPKTFAMPNEEVSSKTIIQSSNSNKKTAVERIKNSIYSSKPSIIFCDISFKSQEVLQFDHTQKIPLHLPPSFKGHYVKYSWYATIAVQHVDAPIKVLHLPIRVINATVDVSTFRSIDNDGNTSEAANPFVLREERQPSIIEIVSSRVEGITSQRACRVFEIRSGEHVFAAITMFKSVFKLGDDIVGRISFPHKEVNCLQVLVRVETVEVDLSGDKREETVCNHFTEHYVTAFASEAVQLRWRIHFEFVTTTKKIMKEIEGEPLTQLAQDIQIETMEWNNYFTVHACNPHNIILLSQNLPQSNVSLVV